MNESFDSLKAIYAIDRAFVKVGEASAEVGGNMDMLTAWLAGKGARAIFLECGHSRIMPYSHHGYLLCRNLECRRNPEVHNIQKVVWVARV